MEYRHELKFIVNDFDIAKLRARLWPSLQPDENSGEAGYMIRKHSPRSEVEPIRRLSNGDFEPGLATGLLFLGELIFLYLALTKTR